MRTSTIHDPGDFAEWLWRYVDRSAQADALLDWIEQREDAGFADDALGNIFWRAVRQGWPSFDRIDHSAYAEAFARFRPQWSGSPEIAALPRLVTIYRGQDARAPIGLSWTTDRKTAASFAHRHRSRRNAEPMVLAAFIERDDIALVLESHGDTNIVVWAPPDCSVV